MRRIATVLGLALALVAGPASAEKPEHAGQGKGKGKEKHDAGPSHDHDGGHGFSSSQHSSYYDWYHDEYGGNCPPGLAKKHNGCLPPGQAKKRYRVGYPLPHGVVIAPLPSALVIRLGPPPSGYRYGFLDGDVVKLAIGTALVVDAIEGLTSR